MAKPATSYSAVDGPGADTGVSAPGGRPCHLAGCDRPGSDVWTEVAFTRGGRDDLLFCTRVHRQEWRAGRARRRSCPACGAGFDPVAAGNGRPATYCQPSCKAERERQLDRAQRDLARDADPAAGKLDQAIADAETLYAAWGPGRWRPVDFDQLVWRRWRGVPPSRLVPPSEAARGALAARVGRLWRLRAEREAAERQRAAAELAAAEAAAVRRVADDKAAADRAWRAELLKGAS